MGCERPLEREIPGQEDDLVAAVREQILAIAAASGGIVTAVGLRKALRVRYDLISRALHELEAEGVLREARDERGHRIGRIWMPRSR